MNPRRWLLALALVVAASLAWWPEPGTGPDIVEPVARVSRPHGPARTPPPPAQSRAGRPVFPAESQADLFPAQSFRPPPPPPPKPLPPPPPMAPPLPFSFVGSWNEAGKDTVFLAQGERVLTTRKGERLPGGWRLDELQAGSLLFTYEPLNQQRTLRTAP